MQNTNKINRLSIILIILTVLAPIGSGYIGILAYIIPYFRILFALLMIILLVISYRQIYLRKERGSLFNLVTALNVVLIAISFNQNIYAWLNENVAMYKDQLFTAVSIIVGLCVIVAVVHLIFKKFRNK